MPRDSNGNYTLPAGNPVVTATPVSSTWANNTLNDVATALTGSLSRSGDGSMLGPLELDSGTLGTPGLSFGAETGLGLYRQSAGVLGIASGGVLAAAFAGASAFLAGVLDLGHASDTTLSRLSAGTVGVEGVALARIDTNYSITGQWTFTATTLFNTGAAGQAFSISSTHASGPYFALTRSGTTFGDIGNAAQLGAGYTLDAIAINARSGFNVELGTNNNMRVRITDTTLYATGTFDLGHASDTTLARIAAGRVSVEGKELANLSDNQVFAGFAQFPTIELGHASDTTITRLGAGLVAVEGVELGWRRLIAGSVTTGAFAVSDSGKCIYATAGVTIPNSTMAQGDVVVIQNTTGAGITITRSITTAYNTASGTALGATFTLGARGRCAILFNSGTECYVSGDIS